MMPWTKLDIASLGVFEPGRVKGIPKLKPSRVIVVGVGRNRV